MSNLLLFLASVVIGTVALRAIQRHAPAWIAERIPALLGAVMLTSAIVLAAKGAFASALVVGALGLWSMWETLVARWRAVTGGAAAGPAQQVRTDHLEALLDPATGSLRGRVTKGFFSGRRIERLRPVELAHLWQDCRHVDPTSARIIEAYLDRLHPSWRDDLARAEAAAPRGPDGKMTREEALDILGLEPGASEEAIRRAHRELMLRLHPDRGGSTYLAAKINEAKDVALGGR